MLHPSVPSMLLGNLMAVELEVVSWAIIGAVVVVVVLVTKVTGTEKKNKVHS